MTLVNKTKVNTATPGTGTVTLGSASSNAFCTFAEAGAVNGDTVSYLILDGNDFEIGTGVYSSAGPTMTRATVNLSKIAGVAGTTKLTLSGTATVSIVARKEDLLLAAVQSDMETATSILLAVQPGVQHFHPGHAKALAMISLTGSAQIAGNISSVDTATEIITWSVAHGLTTGTIIKPNGGTWPAGSTLNTLYYINVPSSTTFSLHLNAADAATGANKVNLTSAGSGTRTLYTITVNQNLWYNISSVALTCASTDLNFTLTTSVTLSAITAGMWLGTLDPTAAAMSVKAPTSTTTILTINSGNGGLPAASGTTLVALLMLMGDLA